MHNKPKYNFFKNTQYALEGLLHLLRAEMSFKIEFIIGFLAFVLIFLLPFELWQKALLCSSYFILLIIEAINSSIESVVDLVTQKHHPLAKVAKDVASAAVFLAIILNLTLWALFCFL